MPPPGAALRRFWLPSVASLALLALAAAAVPATAGVPKGGPQAHLDGVYGPVVPTEVIAIHASLLPNGQVIMYGSDQQGNQTGQFQYDVWDPSLGTGGSSHFVLQNTTQVDLFCSAQSLITASGKLLLTGGDDTINGERNFSNNKTELYDPTGRSINADAEMTYKRWYPSLVALPNGDFVAVGGRQNKVETVLATTPEVYRPGVGWHTLPNADSDLAYGSDRGSWYYPRAFVDPNGKVFIITPYGTLYSLDTSGTGALSMYPGRYAAGSRMLPTLMYDVGKLLSIRGEGKVLLIDINGPTPVVTKGATMSAERNWTSVTVMPDGKVIATGGSRESQQDVYYRNEIWDPATGQWTLGAAANRPRLYHSNALLMPDATIWTAGGGAPGSVTNLNAEIFYPAYLYDKDGSGNPAVRPKILNAPKTVHVGDSFVTMVTSGKDITKASMLRLGSTTHTYNSDQRFLPLKLNDPTQGQGSNPTKSISLALPNNPNVALPGFYMLFMFNSDGTPSVAKIIKVSL